MTNLQVHYAANAIKTTTIANVMIAVEAVQRRVESLAKQVSTLETRLDKVLTPLEPAMEGLAEKSNEVVAPLAITLFGIEATLAQIESLVNHMHKRLDL